MTTQQLNLLAVIGIAACWGVVALAWLAGAIYYQSREPAERTRASYLSPLLITTVIMVVVSAAVPRADWLPLDVHAPWVRLLGLAILLAATALTLWARLALGAMWTAAPTVKQEHQLRTSGPYAGPGWKLGEWREARPAGRWPDVRATERSWGNVADAAV